MHRPFGVPCVAQPDRLPHKLARSAARPRAQTYSSDYPCLVCATRRRTGEGKSKTKFKNKISKPVVGRKAPTYQKKAWACPHKTAVDFPSPERRLDISPTSGGLGEHCPSSAAGHVLCAPPGRVAQPRLLAKYRGNPKGGKPGSPFLWLLSFGEAKESDLPPGNPRQPSAFCGSNCRARMPTVYCIDRISHEGMDCCVSSPNQCRARCISRIFFHIASKAR